MARQLIVELLGDNSRLSKSLDVAGKDTKSFGDKVKGMSVKVGVGVTAAGVAFSALGGPLEDSKLRLTQIGQQAGFTDSELSALTNTNGKLKQAMRASGNGAASVNEALAKLIPVTKNAEEAKKALGVADELAARKGISLEQAAEMVNRSLAGGTKLTKEFGIEIGEGEDRLGALAGVLDGSVSTALQNTMRGRMTAAVETVKDFAGQVGQNLGPALTVLGPAITAIGPAMNIASAAVKGMSAAMTFMAANPIILGILAGGAIIAGLVLLEKKFGLVSKAVDWLKESFRKVWPAIRGVLNVMMGGLEGFANGAIDALTLPLTVLNKIPGVKSIVPDVPNLRLPRFDMGGIVPGPLGVPQLAVVHGGETVTPYGRGGGAGSTTVNVVLNGRTIKSLLLEEERISGPIWVRA